MPDRRKQAHGRNLSTTGRHTAQASKCRWFYFCTTMVWKKIETSQTQQSPVNKTSQSHAHLICTNWVIGKQTSISLVHCVLKFVPMFAFTFAISLIKSSFTTPKTGEATCLTPTCAVVATVVGRAVRRGPIGWRVGHLVGHGVFA